MEKQFVAQARVDSVLGGRITDYAQAHHLSVSEAIRALLVLGLDADSGVRPIRYPTPIATRLQARKESAMPESSKEGEDGLTYAPLDE